MAKWISIDEEQGQIISFDDNSFPFGIYMDMYQKMDGNALPFHWHNLIEFGLVLAGQIEMHIDDEIIILDMGECFFINSNTLHSSKQISTSEDAIVCIVCFNSSLLAENKNGSINKKYFQPMRESSVNGFKISQASIEGKKIHDILCDFSKIEEKSFGYELKIISMVSELWLETLKYVNNNADIFSYTKRAGSPQKETIKQLLIYVQENYKNSISIDILSEHAHISRSECFRLFKQYTGKTPIDYINDYRLMRAEYLLKTSTMPILDICLACGFSGQSYFGKIFKNRYHISPLAYRKKNGTVK